MSLDFNLILENKKVLLRPLVRQDFSLLKNLANDPTLWVYFTHDLSNSDDFDAWAKPSFTGERLQFTVIDRETNNLAGSTAFGNYFPHDQRIEIGWTWLGREFHGSGINRQMKILMLEYAFEKLGMKRVEIKTDVLNLPARKALLRMGITEEGILRSHTLMTRGRRRDTIYYSVLENEWPELKNAFLLNSAL
jgi:RimJ/RimL family protein N-acetyltransferase